LSAGEGRRFWWNAASIAGLLLATEVMIAEAPKDEEQSHGAPGGGTAGIGM
jgi:chaperonin GroEL